MAESKETRRNARLFVGRTLCVLGIVSALVGAYFVAVALDALAVALGVAGYALGSRRLGSVTVVLGIVAVFVGLVFGLDAAPGGGSAVDGILRDPFSGWPAGE